MITKSEFFKKIYFVDNPEVLNSKQMDNLLMVSTKNWNYYFGDLGKKFKEEIILKKLSNVELVEFNSQKYMFSFIQKLNKELFIDFSIEHDKPCLLKFL